MSIRLDLTRSGWGRVILGTVLGSLGCIAIALYVDSFNFLTLDADARNRAILMNILLPLCLAAPMLFYLLSKVRELAIAHQRLAVVAATDSLTTALNRGAFLALAEAALAQTAPPGALLVIDADNFKAINDRFGHDRGDEALRLIAQSIRAALRRDDRVGRIGGEEFGVLLQGADRAQAEAVAERIRAAVNTAEFLPEGIPHGLTVSVGGAVFNGRLSFSELFRIADQQLYLAKHNGRDRVALAPALTSVVRTAA